MFNLVLNFAILVALSLISASVLMKVTSLSFWWGAAFLACLGILLYLINVFLIKHFLDKNAPGVLELDATYGKPMNDGEYLWEKTAGTGIVPKWVSLLGIWSYACFTAIIIWLAAWLKEY